MRESVGTIIAVVLVILACLSTSLWLAYPLADYVDSSGAQVKIQRVFVNDQAKGIGILSDFAHSQEREQDKTLTKLEKAGASSEIIDSVRQQFDDRSRLVTPLLATLESQLESSRAELTTLESGRDTAVWSARGILLAFFLAVAGTVQAVRSQRSQSQELGEIQATLAEMQTSLDDLTARPAANATVRRRRRLWSILFR